MGGGSTGVSFVLGLGFGAVISLLIMIHKRLKSIEKKLSEGGNGSGGGTAGRDE